MIAVGGFPVALPRRCGMLASVRTITIDAVNGDG
jgi:hypothetical protein